MRSLKYRISRPPNSVQIIIQQSDISTIFRMADATFTHP